MSETRASLKVLKDTQRRKFGRAGRGGGVNLRQLSLQAGLSNAMGDIERYLNEIGRFVDTEGRMGSFDFLGHRGTFMYQNRNYEETIVSGEISVRANLAASLISRIQVDTESSASTDDLDTINFEPRKLLNIVVLQAADDARTVVVKDGTGNLALSGDFSLTHIDDTITLMQLANGNFVELARSDNAT